MFTKNTWKPVQKRVILTEKFFPIVSGEFQSFRETNDVKEWHETKKENMHIWFWPTLFQVGVKLWGLPTPLHSSYSFSC